MDLCVPALKSLRAKRRLARIGDDTRRRVTLAWASTVDFLETYGQPPLQTESLQEYADRIQLQAPVTHPEFGELTALAVEAAYRSGPPSAEQAAEAERLARLLHRSIESGQPWPVRSAHGLDPRPLVRLNDPVANLADRLAAGARQN